MSGPGCPTFNHSHQGNKADEETEAQVLCGTAEGTGAVWSGGVSGEILSLSAAV